tara:strand:- start:190 stop:1302 length:1113 start_codon:yes stop_codon:yes gene_type:complete
MSRILILGAYGNFGVRISWALAKKNIPLFLGGRDQIKLENLSKKLTAISLSPIDTIKIDTNINIQQALAQTNPDVVINTCGPFQGNDYSVAKACIEKKVNYIDLADGREFVIDVKTLDAMAKQNHVAIISGASTVPALSSAIIEKFSYHFSKIESMRYGITPGQLTPRGLATTKAVLSYVGQQIKYPSMTKSCYGWQDLYCQTYPFLGKRWMANCDIPDLGLFPEYYRIPSVRFSAGFENPILHIGLWFLSWLIRVGTPIKLQKYAKILLKISNWFDCFGTDNGGMHVVLRGKDIYGMPIELTWYLIAKEGDGPHIPTVPAIILAEKFFNKKLTIEGAYPCVGLVSYDEYFAELAEYHITTKMEITNLSL